MGKVRSIGLLASSVFLAIGLVVCVDNGVNNGTGGSGDGGKGNDIRNYRTVRIGTQTWMAENLDNAVAGSMCYREDASNCAVYGRLYSWEAALRACPSGWRLPSDEDWTVLTDFVGSDAGAMLKSTSGWADNGNGTDNYEFSALPGGIGNSVGSSDAGFYGSWWTSTEKSTTNAWARRMCYVCDYVWKSDFHKTDLISVRCLQDQ